MSPQMGSASCVTSKDTNLGLFHLSSAIEMYPILSLSVGSELCEDLSQRTQYHYVGYLCPLFRLGRAELPWSLSLRGSGLLRLSLLANGARLS